MAKVAYIDLRPDLKDRFSKLFTPLYKTKKSSLRWNGALTPPRKKINVAQRSLLPQIRDLWRGFSDAQRAAWSAAGATQNYSGYSLFVQDMSYRIKYGVQGVATPSPLHAYKCGEILLAAPATRFSIIQEHPIEYFKMRKVKGTKSQLEPVSISETLHLPLTISMSFRSNLTAVGPNPIVRYYAEIYYSYQGLDKTEKLAIDIPLSANWTNKHATCSGVVGRARWYRLGIELIDVQGVLQFDALHADHTGSNFARDFRCNNIAAGFSNYNYQLPAAWAALEPVAGVTFGSVYPDDEL